MALENGKKLVPYKILPFAVSSVVQLGRSRLRLFNSHRS